jgi:hypothetical protein
MWTTALAGGLWRTPPGGCIWDDDEPVFQPPAFHPDRPSVVAPVRVDPSGESGPTRAQARGRHWRRTSQGWYVPVSASADDVHQRAVEAAPLLRPGDAVTGWAALAWCGGRWFDGRDAGGDELPVPLAVEHFVATQPGFHISQEFLRPGHVEVVEGLPVTVAPRSVCFEMRYADTLDQAVVAMDMAAYSDLVSIEEAWTHNNTLWTWTGVPLSRKALALAAENSWSPQETIMRCVWVRHVGRRPQCNVPVFDRSGRHVGTPDLIDPEAGVVGEYDGSLHLAGTQRARDLRREGELRALGLEYVTMVAGDHPDGYGSFRRRLATAYANARWAAEAGRPWTLEQPSWWVDTSTVAARRALDPLLRDRLLRYRRAA